MPTAIPDAAGRVILAASLLPFLYFAGRDFRLYFTARKVSLALAALGRRLVRSTDIFTIAIKPFMDRHDQDRIANCCHHLMDTGGRAVSFCEYNALVRPRDSWAKFPMLR